MASNYYSYSYGNTSTSSYAQGPPATSTFVDPYATSANSQAAAANSGHASSQGYYQNEQTSSRQPVAHQARQSVPEPARSNTTQYNGLHFPTPAPPRQPATPRDTGRSTSAAPRRSNASSVDTPGGYGTGGYAQTVAQQRQPTATAGALHDRAEQALSASSGWHVGSGTDTSASRTASASKAAAPAASSTDYAYSYQKQDAAPQHSYYTAPRSTATTAQSAGYATQNYHPPAAQTATSSTSASQRQSSQQQQYQPAATTTSYSRGYDSSRTETPASSYQQPATTPDYAKQYQDDTDQSYLHKIYTLPQPTPTRTHADTSSSYNASSHTASENPYFPSTSSQPTTAYQPPSSSSRIQESRPSSNAAAVQATNMNYPTTSSQHYYPGYSDTTSQPQAASYASIPVATASQSQPAVPTAQAVEAAPPKSTKVAAKRQSASQKSPTAKTPKSRAPRKPKPKATPAASAPPEAALPPQHTYFPTESVATTTQTPAAMTIVENPSVQATPAPEDGLTAMEAHMREMVEKMREYQSRDPTAFQQVWENVKKAGPNATGVKPPTSTPMAATKSAAGGSSPHVSAAKPAIQAQAATEGRSTPVPGSAASRAQRTHWPAEQKTALSQTTARFFNNLGQKCTESFIVGLLDSGPTFAELCLRLEAEGYRFEKNKLAQELLNTSDKIGSSGSKKKASSTAAPAISAAKPDTVTPTGPPRNPTPQSIKSFNPRNIKDSISTFNSMEQVATPQNYIAPSLVYREVYPTLPESSTRITEPALPQTPTPAVSQQSPESGKGKTSASKSRSQKAQAQAQAPEAPTPHFPTAQTPIDPQLQTLQFQQPPAPMPVFPSANDEVVMVDASPIYPPPARLEGFTAPNPISPNAIRPPAPLAPPVPFVPFDDTDAQSTLERLQSRLEAQMSRVKALTSPPKPPAPPIPLTIPTQPLVPPPPVIPKKQLLPRAPEFDKKQALRINNYDPETIVHAVLLATGRHPHYEGLNSRLNILKRLHPDTFDNATDLGSIDWDLYDPPPAPLPGEDSRRSMKRGSVVPGFIKEEEETRGRKRDPVPLVTPEVRRIAENRSDSSPPVSVTPDGKVRGKRGRPRGSRGIARAAAAAARSTRNSINANVDGTPVDATGDPSTAANAGKYGAPQGGRVNIHSIDRNGNGGRGGGNGNGGRKRKHDNSPPSRFPGGGRDQSEDRKTSSFSLIFKCHWEKCDAELQNLETLKRHVVRKHKVENEMGVIPCCWGECGSLIPVESQDAATGKKVIEQRRKRLNFGTGAAWDNHVLSHLKAVKEEFGEGMSVNEARSLSRASSAHSVEGRIRSMSMDRSNSNNNRPVTPVINTAPLGYKFTPPPGFSSSTQFRIAHDVDNSWDEKRLADEEFARIARIGAGMEAYSVPTLPGMEYDSGRGLGVRVRKVAVGWQLFPPFVVRKPPVVAVLEGEKDAATAAAG